MIVPVEVCRDERGYWTHPALIRSCCETTPQLMWWLRVQKLTCFVMTMRDEAPEAFCAAWNDGPPDASTWELIPPPGEGWFWGRSIKVRTGLPATGSAQSQQPEDSTVY